MTVVQDDLERRVWLLSEGQVESDREANRGHLCRVLERESGHSSGEDRNTNQISGVVSRDSGWNSKL